MILLELTGADLGETLRRLTAAGAVLREVTPSGDLSLRLRTRRRYLGRIRRICKKQGDSLRILGQNGMFYRVLSLRRRPVLVLGLGLLCFLMAFLPTRILFLRVEGNQRVPANRILEAAGECGVGFWARGREIRSEDMKNHLLGKIPQLQWAGVNVNGSLAVISVRERSDAEETKPGPGISSLVAAADGVVESVSVTDGTLLCTPGQAVTKGQVLISGYTDCGLSLRGTRARGEIFARTLRTVSAVSPSRAAVPGKETGRKRKFSLLIGKNRINFGKDSGIWDPTCGRMYEEYYITLPGGFTLPLGLGVDEYVFRQTEEVSLPAPDLSGFAKDCLRDTMIAGRILLSRETLTEESGVHRLTGTCLCLEMIGRERQEQIGE